MLSVIIHIAGHLKCPFGLARIRESHSLMAQKGAHYHTKEAVADVELRLATELASQGIPISACDDSSQLGRFWMYTWRVERGNKRRLEYITAALQSKHQLQSQKVSHKNAKQRFV